MKDPRIEQVLESNPNVAWEYITSVPLRDIDEAKSHDNQARVDRPLDIELVRQYKESLLAGDEFPAVVLFPDGDKYVVSDGNHRVAGRKAAGRKTVDAYVVLTDNVVERALLTYEWNVINGKPSAEEDRDRHAIYLVQQNLTKKEVAHRLHMSVKRVEEVMAEDVGHTRAMSLGCKNSWAKLPSRYARVRIANDLTLDPIFQAFVRFAAKYELTTKQIREGVAEVKALRSEQEQALLIAKTAKKLQAEIDRAKSPRASGNNPGRTVKGMWEMHTAYIKQHADVQTFEDLILRGLTEDELKAMLVDTINAKTSLADVEALITKKLKTSV